MADTAQRSAPAETTFTKYTKDQGIKYAQARRGYHPKLYKTVIDHHISTGGQLESILDVGCGPGTAVRALAPHFSHAIGFDPSDGMIVTARDLAGTTCTSEPIRFEISTAEDLGSHLSPPIKDASIDLITASTAAHWFDMPRFWTSAARVLKPGGTVAIWTTGRTRIHPSVPNAEAMQAAVDDMEERELRPFFVEGNLLTRDLYAGLPLPWTLMKPVVEFEEASFVRKYWGPGNNEEIFDGGELSFDMDTLEKILATGSPVHRWREAHPDDVGAENDILRRMRREIERLLHEAGVEKGKEMVKGSPEGVMLLVKKRT